MSLLKVVRQNDVTDVVPIGSLVGMYVCDWYCIVSSGCGNHDESTDGSATGLRRRKMGL